MPIRLILGASRGIGHELARQYAAQGDRVLATYRQEADGPALAALGVEALRVDLLQDDCEAVLAGALKGALIDTALIVAGVGGPQASEVIAPTREEFDAVMRTNVFVSMRLIPFLAAGRLARGAKLAVLSSRMGSIGGASSASWWLYRASKAALNSVLKSASLALASQDIVCLSLHPGWVRTDMGGAGADLGVEESAASLLRVVAATNRSHNGRFLNYNGEQLEW